MLFALWSFSTMICDCLIGEAAVILADAMAELPEDYRQVVVLRNIEGKTFPEIAQKMDRSLNSVKNLWFRAFDRLRELLEQLR